MPHSILSGFWIIIIKVPNHGIIPIPDSIHSTEKTPVPELSKTTHCKPSVYKKSSLTSPSHFPGGSDGKESACNSGDLGSIPGSGRSPGEGLGYPLQYSGLENPKDRGAWRAAVHGVTKGWTWLSATQQHLVETSLASPRSAFSLTAAGQQIQSRVPPEALPVVFV